MNRRRLKGVLVQKKSCILEIIFPLFVGSFPFFEAFEVIYFLKLCSIFAKKDMKTS